VLACESKQYLGTYLSEAGAKPILYTTTLMCPEAYTLHDAVAAYLSNDTTQIRPAAVKAYNKYQKCGLALAEKILVSGA